MKYFVLGLGILAAAFLDSCSTDFDLNADFKETPVVYALLDASADTQYVRINRAYLSDEIDALTLAQDPNAIYYGDELTARVEEYNFGTLVATYPLLRVDGDTLGIPKQEGIFANVPNILYRFIAPVNYTHTYKIVAENSETGISISAETAIVDSFATTTPDDESIFPFSVSLAPNGLFRLRWESAQDAKIYDITMRFHYREGIYYPEGDSIHYTNSAYIDWLMETNFETETTQGGLQKTFDITGDAFYGFIADHFDPVGDENFIRLADSVQFILDAGGQELYDYVQFTNASLGITEGESTDAYTNVTGGLGVVSSRYHRVGKIYPLGIQTRDSIACSTVTGGLNFAPDPSSPAFPYCD